MKNRNMVIVLVTLGVILVVILIINLLPKKTSDREYMEQVNSELNSAQLQVLLKEMEKYLSITDNIENGDVFSPNEMAAFSFSYVAYFDTEGKKHKLDEENSLGIIGVEELKENIKYIFGVDLNVYDLDYEIIDNNIYIPLNLQGGDAQVYRYVSTTHNEQNGTYIANIDVLEPASYEEAEELLAGKKYDKESILFTLQLKYKVVDGRRILLAYTAI